MNISKTDYDHLLDNDLVESFEMMLQHKVYINAIAVDPSGEDKNFKVTVAIYRFDEPVSNTSELHGDWDYKTGADAIEYHVFDTHQEAFAHASSIGTQFMAELQNTLFPS